MGPAIASLAALCGAAIAAGALVLVMGRGMQWAAMAALCIGSGRLVETMLVMWLRRSRRGARRVLVVGARGRALDVFAMLSGAGITPVGVLVDGGASAQPQLGGLISALAHAEDVVRREAVDDVIIAIPWSQPERLAACLDVFKPLTVGVHLFPDDPAPFVDGGTEFLAGVPLARLRNRPLSGAGVLLKALEDRVLGAVLLVLLSPVLLVVAIAVKLDSPGPVLFRQLRYGYDNQLFTCLKFRSMVVRPEEKCVVQATRTDPRITRVGKFIRRTSLDELPQLFNVVGGSMSLVGPRPHALSHHDTYSQLVDDYRCRHRMKPGITGWAQVNGYRGETQTIDLMRQRVIHDLWYIEHWSFWLDLMILARTPLACFKATNAY